jgi:hypothetical protein
MIGRGRIQWMRLRLRPDANLHYLIKIMSNSELLGYFQIPQKTSGEKISGGIYCVIVRIR